MSATPSHPLKSNQVLSALDAKIEQRSQKGQGRPLEGLATKPVEYLINNLEWPWPVKVDLHDLEGRTFIGRNFTGLGMATLLDPTAHAPTGPHGTVPLMIMTHDPQLPPDYNDERPRIIDVTHPQGFQKTTDCTRLRAMDAIVTILYHDSPQLLKKVCAKPDLRDGYTTIQYDRYADHHELFDLQIHCETGGIILRLLQKMSTREGIFERKEFASIKARYDFGPNGHKTERRHDVWMRPWVSGPCWDDEFSRRSSETPQVDEDRGRRLARYLLLLRPWEEKAGVRVKRRVRTQYEEYEVPPRNRKENLDGHGSSVVDPGPLPPEDPRDWGWQTDEKGVLVWRKKKS